MSASRAPQPGPDSDAAPVKAAKPEVAAPQTAASNPKRRQTAPRQAGERQAAKRQDAPRSSGQQRGRDGEDLAAAYLRARGAQIVARNWRPSGLGVRGEVDIIAQLGEWLCFVEVKTRADDVRGAPQEAVGPAKQRQISRLANAYLSELGRDDICCRFDVVEVWLSPGQQPRLAHLPNAFDFQAR